MSFDFNINQPNPNLSNVQASAKSMPGGGGNTGYFRRDGESEENKKYLESQNDTFEKGDIVFDDNEEESDILKMFLRFVEKIINKIKDMLQGKVEE